MIVPKQAPVRPRVLSALTGDSLLLEEELRGRMADRRRGSVRLAGPSGSGKTTALAHLAHVFAGANVLFLDCPAPEEFPPFLPDRWIVFSTTESASDFPVTNSYQMAPWREDEWIEYLLTAHKERCRSVMLRLLPNLGAELLEGSPRLSVVALDELAAREDVPTAGAALVRHAEERIPGPDGGAQARREGLCSLLGPTLDPGVGIRSQKPVHEALIPLLCHRPVQLLLAAAQIVADVRDGGECPYFIWRLPRDLVRQAGADLAGQPALREVLDGWLRSRPDHQAMTASLLHAAGWSSTPPAGDVHRLGGAYLDGVTWPAAVLEGANLRGADLSHSDLRAAKLRSALLDEADLRGTNLQAASLVGVSAAKANLAGAVLQECDLTGSVFEEANLEGADLQGANVQTANLGRATLTEAAFTGADLRHACLVGAAIDGADFTGADLGAADLRGLALCTARFAGARFGDADLRGSDLEGMELPAADFRGANLAQALLTGSMMPGACFDQALLRAAGLAEIEWEGASLRGADLRGASFHLGSSRSGRVGSPRACEGSRTGFYTDDFTEQDFKSPEEIRKANLCYADLRGALIEGVDFYLVDVRHAQLDPEQEAHIRRCGGILEGRAA
jgi:uncharacterized protein YjbI with pentapeptide repeats